MSRRRLLTRSVEVRASGEKDVRWFVPDVRMREGDQFTIDLADSTVLCIQYGVFRHHWNRLSRWFRALV